MRIRMMMALTFLMVATGPAVAQDTDKSGLRSETEAACSIRAATISCGIPSGC